MRFDQVTVAMLAFIAANTFFAVLASGNQKFTPVNPASQIFAIIAAAQFAGHIYLVKKVLVLVPLLVLSVSSLRFMIYLHNNSMFEFRRPKEVKKSRRIDFKPNEVKKMGKRVGRGYITKDGRTLVYDCN